MKKLDVWFTCKDVNGLIICPPVDVIFDISPFNGRLQLLLKDHKSFNNNIDIRNAIVNMFNGILELKLYLDHKHLSTHIYYGVECSDLSGDKSGALMYIKQIGFRYRARVKTQYFEL